MISKRTYYVKVAQKIARGEMTVSFRKKTEAQLRTLHPRTQRVARAHLYLLNAHGIDARLGYMSGTRTATEHQRIEPGRAASASYHLAGMAYDIKIYDHKNGSARGCGSEPEQVFMQRSGCEQWEG